MIEVGVNATAYDDGDIEGATLWNVYGDLKDAQYHLVDAAPFERLVAASGINADSTVVFHDQIGVSPRPSTLQIYERLLAAA